MRQMRKWIRKYRSNPNIRKKTWKEYKRGFLWKRKAHYWKKFKHFFNNIRIYKKYYVHNNIFKSTNTIVNYRLSVSKKSFSKSYSFLHKLHFRLHLILVHSHFVMNKFESLGFLKNGLISVNNKIITHPNYCVKLQDLLYLFTKNIRLNSFLRKKFLLKIRNKRYKRLNRFRYKYLKRCLLKNFFEISYHTRSLIYLRTLRNTELRKKKIKKIKKWSRKRFKFINIFNLRLIKKFWAFN